MKKFPIDNFLLDKTFVGKYSHASIVKQKQSVLHSIILATSC